MLCQHATDDGLRIEGNWIKLTNQYRPAHVDGIQASTELGTIHENITLQYKYVENTKNMTSNSQGIYLTQMNCRSSIVCERQERAPVFPK